MRKYLTITLGLAILFFICAAAFENQTLAQSPPPRLDLSPHAKPQILSFSGLKLSGSGMASKQWEVSQGHKLTFTLFSHQGQQVLRAQYTNQPPYFFQYHPLANHQVRLISLPDKDLERVYQSELKKFNQSMRDMQQMFKQFPN